MAYTICVLSALLVSCLGASLTDVDQASDAAPVENQLQELHVRLSQLYMENSEQIENLSTQLQLMRQSLDSLVWSIQRMERSVQVVGSESALLVRNVSQLTVQSDQIMINQQYCANHEALKDLFFELTPKCSIPNPSIDPPVNRFYSSCSEAPDRSGVYKLAPYDTNDSFEAFCEQEKYGGGWIVFQSRQDGSVNFNRSWSEYRDGFGQASGEYWLGLQRLHNMTRQGGYELLVVMENFTNFPVYETYSSFWVDTESTNYTLRLQNAGSGSAGDALYGYRSEKFVTYDRGVGSTYYGCVNKLGSGFWHYSCDSYGGRNNLNGVYGRSSGDPQSIWWGNFNNGRGTYDNPLKRVQMMVRKFNLTS